MFQDGFHSPLGCGLVAAEANFKHAEVELWLCSAAGYPTVLHLTSVLNLVLELGLWAIALGCGVARKLGQAAVLEFGHWMALGGIVTGLTLLLGVGGVRPCRI